MQGSTKTFCTVAEFSGTMNKVGKPMYALRKLCNGRVPDLSLYEFQYTSTPESQSKLEPYDEQNDVKKLVEPLLANARNLLSKIGFEEPPHAGMMETISILMWSTRSIHRISFPVFVCS